MTTGEDLAVRFTQSREEFVEAVHRLTDEQWKLRSASEGWTIGAVVQHLAAGELGYQRARDFAEGDPSPGYRDMGEIDALNANDAEEFEDCDREETLELLRRNIASMAVWMRGLSDEELGRTGQMVGHAPLTTLQLIEGLLIPHAGTHLVSIGATLERMD